MEQDQMVADMVSQNFQGSRLARVEVAPGQPNGIRLVFENPMDEEGSVMIQATLKTELQGSTATLRAQTNFQVVQFKAKPVVP